MQIQLKQIKLKNIFFVFLIMFFLGLFIQPVFAQPLTNKNLEVTTYNYEIRNIDNFPDYTFFLINFKTEQKDYVWSYYIFDNEGESKGRIENLTQDPISFEPTIFAIKTENIDYNFLEKYPSSQELNNLDEEEMQELVDYFYSRDFYVSEKIINTPRLMRKNIFLDTVTNSIKIKSINLRENKVNFSVYKKPFYAPILLNSSDLSNVLWLILICILISVILETIIIIILLDSHLSGLKKENKPFLYMFVINLLTVPISVFIYEFLLANLFIILFSASILVANILTLFILEVLIVFAEAGLLKKILKLNFKIALRVSIVANLFSVIAGAILFL